MSNTWIATAEDFGLAVPAAEPQILGDPYLDICPPSLQLPAVAASDSRIAMRPVVWSQGGDLPRSVKERDTGRPLVYVTLGTALVKAEVLREAVEGLSRLPVDVLVSAGRKVAVEELGEVSDWVQVEEWVPQGDLLPLVDLVVSHGGSGTMLGALACGVPHLVIPQGADQFSNAQVLVDAGLGRRILPAELGAEVVRTEAEALLDDQLTFARVSDLSREVAGMPAPAEALQRLVELTR
jgi:MGT family glycosyltransferase